MIEDTRVTRRRAFGAAAGVFTVLGVLLFVFAESVATLPAQRAGNAWPWPIGPLALRFVACLLMAAAVATGLTALRPDNRTVRVFCMIAGLESALLLVQAALNAASFDWSKPLAFAWLGAVALGAVGCAVLGVRAYRGEQAEALDLPPTPRAARWVEILITLLTGGVGAIMLFFPEMGRERWPWDLSNSTNVQLMGVLFFSVGLDSLLALLHRSWYGFDIFFPAAGLFAAVALVAIFMHWNLFAIRPLTSWIFVIVYLAGAMLGFVPYALYALEYRRGLTHRIA